MKLSTQYLGLELKSPLVASASPLSKSLDGIRRLEDAGASAIVMFSLFEEQINGDQRSFDHDMQFGTDTHEEARSFVPSKGSFPVTPESYLEMVRQANAAVDVPIIASLNGVNKGKWVEYANQLEQAGAAAIELNLYKIASDPGVLAAEVERKLLSVVRAVKAQVKIPVSVKISPFFSSLPNMARGLSLAGAQGIVMFNRFYEPDFDLDNLEVMPRLTLSCSDDLRLPLHWTAILFGRVDADLALSGGVHTHLDAIKAIAAGAKVAMVASELLKNGADRLGQMEKAMSHWMEEHKYESLNQLLGNMSYLRVADPGTVERASYIKELGSFKSEMPAFIPQ